MGRWGFLWAACLMTSCGSDDDTCTPDNAVLSGVIAGVNWTFAQGSTDAFFSDSEQLDTTLYSAMFTTCDAFDAPSGSQLLVSIPTEPGSYDFNLQLNMTYFVPPSDNFVATRGKIIVNTVTPTTVTAQLCSSFDKDNEVSGIFTADICP